MMMSLYKREIEIKIEYNLRRMFSIYNNNITREVNKLLLEYYFLSIVFVEPRNQLGTIL